MSTIELLEKMTEIIPQVINTKVPVRVRRGLVNSTICRILKIPRSNTNVKLIRAVLKASGVREVTIRARRFYVSYPDANPNRTKVRTKTSDK